MLEKRYRRIVPGLMAAAMVSAFTPTNLVFADEEEKPSEALPVLSASTRDTKQQIADKAVIAQTLIDDKTNLDEVSLKDSSVSLSGFNPDKKGLQLVRAEVNLAKTDENGKTSLSVTPEYSELVVDVKKDALPNLKLKQTEVTVDNGSTFVPANFIYVTPDDDGDLPIISINSNVDTSKDGNYTVVYEARNEHGKTTVTLNVTVKTPEEVIRAREEAARKAEEERKRAEEAERQRQAQLEAQQQAQQRAQAAAQAQTQVANVSTPAGTSSVAQQIINIARSWVGRGIYSYAGNNPATGVDCSGFTKYVFAQVGITLNRVAASQTANGYYVSTPMPGDLAIWTGHAAIYSGNGMIIHASSPSTGIVETTVGWCGSASGAFLGYYRIPGVY